LDYLRADLDPEKSARQDELEKREPDWPAIIDLAKECLTTTSKDLFVAARLAEALLMVHGFAGLRDGFILLRRLVEECWDRLMPSAKDADGLEVRAACFRWIEDPMQGGKFPTRLHCAPLLWENGITLSYLDCVDPLAVPNVGGREQFSPAVRAALTKRREDMVETIRA